MCNIAFGKVISEGSETEAETVEKVAIWLGKNAGPKDWIERKRNGISAPGPPSFKQQFSIICVREKKWERISMSKAGKMSHKMLRRKERKKKGTRGRRHILHSTGRFALLHRRWQWGRTRSKPAPVSAPPFCRAPTPARFPLAHLWRSTRRASSVRLITHSQGDLSRADRLREVW